MRLNIVELIPTLLMLKKKLLEFVLKVRAIFQKNIDKKKKYSLNRFNGRKIKALIAVHVFGMPCEIVRINKVCKKYNIKVIEDAAESIGSFYKNKHLGTFSLAGVISFNGNKTITSGNGAMVLTNNKKLAKKNKTFIHSSKIKSPMGI